MAIGDKIKNFYEMNGDETVELASKYLRKLILEIEILTKQQREKKEEENDKKI